jgi:pyruvate dehydrogenase E1 component alpha subunit
MSDHTTADDASRYRSKEEVEKWKQKDPILRLKLFMEKNGLWTEQYQKEVEEKAKEIVDEAVKKEESIKHPEVEDMFRYTYEKPSQRQIKQITDFKK